MVLDRFSGEAEQGGDGCGGKIVVVMEPEDRLPLLGEAAYAGFVGEEEFFPKQRPVCISACVSSWIFNGVQEGMCCFLFAYYLNDLVADGRVQVGGEILDAIGGSVQPDVCEDVLDDIFRLVGVF